MHPSDIFKKKKNCKIHTVQNINSRSNQITLFYSGGLCWFLNDLLPSLVFLYFSFLLLIGQHSHQCQYISNNLILADISVWPFLSRPLNATIFIT